MRLKALTALAVFFTVFFPHFGHAQPTCGPVNGMEEHFQEQFGERVIYEAVDGEGNIFVFMVNDQTQSWTLVIHDGVTGCVVAAGSGVLMVPTGMAL